MKAAGMQNIRLWLGWPSSVSKKKKKATKKRVQTKMICLFEKRLSVMQTFENPGKAEMREQQTPTTPGWRELKFDWQGREG